MKTKLNFVIIGLVLLSIVGWLPEASAQPRLSLGTARGFPGETVPVPVSLTDVTNAVAAQWDVAYNPTKVMLEGVMPGEGLSNHVVRTREVAPGVQRVLLYSLVNAALSVTNRLALSTLPFAVDANERVGSGPITPVNAILARADSSVVPVSLQPGKIFVAPVHQDLASGVVEFFLPSEAGSNYVIEATQDFYIWEPLSTNMAVSQFLDLMDADAMNHTHRFYRARQAP